MTEERRLFWRWRHYEISLQRQPMVSAQTPTISMPSPNPISWPPPIKEKKRLRSFPGEKFSEMMLTADGRHMAVARPEKTRNTTSCVPFSERPQAMQKILWKKQPSRKMSLLGCTNGVTYVCLPRSSPYPSRLFDMTKNCIPAKPIGYRCLE